VALHDPQDLAENPLAHGVGAIIRVRLAEDPGYSLYGVKISTFQVTRSPEIPCSHARQ